MKIYKTIILVLIIIIIIELLFCLVVKQLPPKTYYNDLKVEYCVDMGDNLQYEIGNEVFTPETGECSYKAK